MRVFGCNKGVTNCVTKGVTNVKKSAGSEPNQRSRDFELCNSVLVTALLCLKSSTGLAKAESRDFHLAPNRQYRYSNGRH